METGFLLALSKDDDRIQERAEDALAEREAVTAPFAYLETLIVLERHRFDYVRLSANLIEAVPVGSKDEQRIALKAVAYFEDGMTPFDVFHAATAETRGLPVVSSGNASDGVDPERRPLEPKNGE